MHRASATTASCLLLRRRVGGAKRCLALNEPGRGASRRRRRPGRSPSDGIAVRVEFLKRNTRARSPCLRATNAARAQRRRRNSKVQRAKSRERENLWEVAQVLTLSLRWRLWRSSPSTSPRETRDSSRAGKSGCAEQPRRRRRRRGRMVVVHCRIVSRRGKLCVRRVPETSRPGARRCRITHLRGLTLW